jgi:DNA-binding SARP family transcriptional activator
MHVELLGPLRLYRYGAEVSMPAAKTQIIFAALVLNAGSVLPTHQLVDELWGEQPPTSATRTVQTYIYHIRKRLSLGDNRDASATDRTLLLTRSGGYELYLPDTAVVDASRFTDLLDAARRQAGNGQLAESVSTLRTALDLWRGQPLAGLEVGQLLSVARVRLEQARISALELRIDSELALGHHRALLDELHALVLADPTHEGYSARLMIALHRSVRRAEALDVYHRLRQRLDNEHGVPPSAGLQQLFQEVLTDDQPRPAIPDPRVVIRQAPNRPLPGDTELLGRNAEQAQLNAALAGVRASQATEPLVVEVIGGPGVGTTSFVAHAAHEFGAGYADGSILIDLDGVDTEPGSSSGTQLLAERMCAAGVPISRSASLDDVARQFQAWARDRQLLTVVDHTASVRLLAALRPRNPGSALIAVNHFGTPGQVGDAIVELPPLGPDAARGLLNRIAGRDRLCADPATAARLTELCAGNPLVLCAVGRWVACQPNVPIARLARGLELDRGRLARLWWSGRSLEESIRRRFRRLSGNALAILGELSMELVASHKISPVTVAEQLNRERDQVEAALDELAGAQLIDEITRPHHPRLFRMPSIMRLERV